MGAATMQYNNVNRYRQVEAETNDPLKLVVMLFEGAINFLEQAKLRLGEGNVKDKGILITKVIAIIGELQSSLNIEVGGEFAFNMDRLYTYMNDRLFTANSTNDEEGMDEVLKHLRTLKGAWDQARQNLPGATAQNIAPAATVSLASQGPATGYATQIPTPPKIEESDEEQSPPAIEIMG